jgi:hypothetical protein
MDKPVVNLARRAEESALIVTLTEGSARGTWHCPTAGRRAAAHRVQGHCHARFNV